MELAANHKTTTSVLDKINIYSEVEKFCSDNRIKLLAAIGQHASVTAAAGALSLSYKAACDALASMSNLSDQPLVIHSNADGLHDRAQLTDYAQRLLAIYKTLAWESQASTGNHSQIYRPPTNHYSEQEIVHFRRIMRRINFRSSTRNHFIGIITAINQGSVNALVAVRVSPEITINALISQSYVDQLNLSLGSEISALLKASEIAINPHPTATGASDLINQFTGKLSQLSSAKIYSDLHIELADQKNINAIVANEQLNLAKLGEQITITFEASSVILCYYN